MNVQYTQVREFHEKFGHPYSDTPVAMDADRRDQRYSYMTEELIEFLTARTVVDQADAMIDLIYFALGTLVELGVKPDPLFNIVHAANLSKLWPDGTVKYHEGSRKVLKPPTFERPEPLLAAEIERQKSAWSRNIALVESEMR